MRVMLARQLAASPWMNPERWRAATPTGVLAPTDLGWRRDHYAAALASGATAGAAAERARHTIMAARIFPPERLITALPSLTARPGDTIAQGIRLGPVGIIAAVRVLTVFDRDRDGVRRAGLSYVTLAGHPARGALTVAVVEDRPAAAAHVEIDAISLPGHWLTRLLGPVARSQQQSATRAALRFIVAQATTSPPVFDGARPTG